MSPNITVNQEITGTIRQILTRPTVSGVGRPGGASIL